MDKRFISYDLVEDLKKNKLSFIGTVKKNKPQLPNEIKYIKKLAVSSSIFGFQTPWSNQFGWLSCIFFSDNFKAVSDEGDERFHQPIAQIEKRYSEKLALKNQKKN